MTSRKITQTLAAFIFVTLCIFNNISYALEDDRYDDSPMSERFSLRIGSFIISSFDTTTRFDSEQFPVGSLIDLEDDLGVESSETVQRIDGFYRFSKQHRIDWTYYRSRREGTAKAVNDLIIGDPANPQGGFIIPAGSSVDTVWNFDLLKVGYAWSFLNKRRYEMFIGAGLNIRQLNVEIEPQLAITTFSEHSSFTTDSTIPLPSAAIGGRWNFSDKWQAIFSYEFFLLEAGNFKGNQQDFQLLLEHNTFKHIGFGVGINNIFINLRAENNTLRGEFDSRMQGVLGYVKFYM